MGNYTLNELAIGWPGRAERLNAIDKAMQHQADIWGEKLVLQQCLEVLSERQKSLVLAQVILATKCGGEGEADSLTTGVEDAFNLEFAHEYNRLSGSERLILRHAMRVLVDANKGEAA